MMHTVINNHLKIEHQTNNMFEITRISKQKFEKFNVEKIILDICFKNYKINLNETITTIFNNHVKVANKTINYSKKIRIGISLKIKSLENDLHVEYTSLDNVYDKINSLEDRLQKIIQSNKSLDLNKITIIFTILNLK